MSIKKLNNYGKPIELIIKRNIRKNEVKIKPASFSLYYFKFFLSIKILGGISLQVSVLSSGIDHSASQQLHNLSNSLNNQHDLSAQQPNYWP